MKSGTIAFQQRMSVDTFWDNVAKLILTFRVTRYKRTYIVRKEACDLRL